MVVFQHSEYIHNFLMHNNFRYIFISMDFIYLQVLRNFAGNNYLCQIFIP